MAVDNKGRAGRYVKQLTGYRAFLPAPLPPEPPLRMDNGLWEALSKADRALGRLDGSTTLPDPDLFVFMYVRKEAVLSSQIEGTQASLTDLLAFESDPTDEPRVRDVAEVANRAAIGSQLGRSAGKALRLHEALFRQPLLSVSQMTEVVDLSYSNANILARQVEDLGLLREITGQKRNRVYSYEPYLELFKDPEETQAIAPTE